MRETYQRMRAPIAPADPPPAELVAELIAAADAMVHALVTEHTVYAEESPREAFGCYLVSVHTFLLRLALLRRDGDRTALAEIADALLRAGAAPLSGGATVH
jgi:hypothetical protein